MGTGVAPVATGRLWLLVLTTGYCKRCCAHRCPSHWQLVTLSDLVLMLLAAADSDRNRFANDRTADVFTFCLDTLQEEQG
jgi:hypothetical protein